MKEKKARVEDALHATRAAIEEGIVPGGGVALIRSLAKLDKLEVEGDQQFGVNLIKRAVEEPLRQIVKVRWSRRSQSFLRTFVRQREPTASTLQLKSM